MKNYIIETENLCVHYGNLVALDNINLQVEKGEFLAIIGPNGSGKTTLVKTLLGLIKPTTGNIRIGNQETKSNLGYVPQIPRFHRNFPILVKEIILTGRLTKKSLYKRRYDQTDYDAVQSIMMELDISNLAERPVSALSGGQLQRVLIARALAVEPQILLLDEPTASLDANSRDQIHNLLQKLNEKVTIIMVTHDMGVISTHVRSIACLNQTLHYHGDAQLSPEAISKTFGCAVDLIAHGVPHRHLDRHAGDKGCCDV